MLLHVYNQAFSSLFTVIESTQKKNIIIVYQTWAFDCVIASPYLIELYITM